MRIIKKIKSNFPLIITGLLILTAPLIRIAAGSRYENSTAASAFSDNDYEGLNYFERQKMKSLLETYSDLNNKNKEKFTIYLNGLLSEQNNQSDESVSDEAQTQNYPIISWENAKNYYDQTVVVEGEIVATYNTGNVCFLNFHKDYRNYLTVVIFASSFEQFPPNPEIYYRNKKVRVEGSIVRYENSPEIILRSSDQIEIIE